MNRSCHTSTVCVGVAGSKDRSGRTSTHPIRLLLLAVGTIVVIVTGLAQFNQLFRSQLNAPIDFAAFWAAGHLAVEGENAYRGDQLAEVQASVGLTDLAVTAWNPPWTLALLMPIGAVPFRAAYGLWVLAHLGLMAASALMLWKAFDAPKRHGWLPLVIAFTFVPTVFLIGGGQLTAVVLFGLAGFALACRMERPILAGAALALVAVKPHLLVPFGVWLLISGCRTPFGRRVLLGALAAGVLMCVPPTLAAPRVWLDYFAALTGPPTAGIRPRSAWQPPLVGWWLRQPSPGAPFWVQWTPTALAALVTAAWCVRTRSRFTAPEALARLPWLVGVSLLVAPYGAWAYDLVLLLFAVLAVSARLADAPDRRAGIAVAWLMSVNAVSLVMMLLGASSEWYVWFAPCVLLGAWAVRVEEPDPASPTPENKTDGVPRELSPACFLGTGDGLGSSSAPHAESHA